MMRRYALAILCVLVLSGAVLAGCTTPALPGPTFTPAPETPTPLATTSPKDETPAVAMSAMVDRLVASVESTGAKPTVGDAPATILFPSAVEARVITIPDPTVNEEIHIYRFATADDAALAATTVDPNGTTIGGANIQWQMRPHFYHVEQYIIVYIGTTNELRTAMNSELGDPFAEG